MDYSARHFTTSPLRAARAHDEGSHRFVELITGNRITSHFQPIVDMFSGEIFGYELLARGEGEFTAPAALFETAERLGLSWELEHACRMSALRRIGEELDRLSLVNFFINVSPQFFSASSVQNAFTMENLEAHGVDSSRVVLEVTETASVGDYESFEETIRYYVDKGFRIALDDFGSGHSGLITLVATTPHILKIDKQLVSGIHRSSYKQNLVRAVAEFADTVGSAVLVEGIEGEDELRTAYRLGARYAQGFYFGRPAAEPREMSPDVAVRVTRLRDEYSRRGFAVDISINRLISRPPSFGPGELNGNQLDTFFRTQNSVNHIVVVDGEDRPKGLMTRKHFYTLLSGRYGYAIFQKKNVEAMMKRGMLVVTEETDLRVLGKLAMARGEEDVYDPVVVVDTDQRLIGTISMKKVIDKAFDTEVRYATSANPLTGLPGNLVINVWLEELLLKPEYSIVYFDLDRFKEFNDRYGFTAGDEIIKMVAELLSDHMQQSRHVCRLGHVGGDDFIMLVEGVISSELLEGICREFDMRKRPFFTNDELERGSFESRDRRGNRAEVVLTTLSAAVITQHNFRRPPHPGRLGQVVASLKGKGKANNLTRGRSGFIIDRRIHARS